MNHETVCITVLALNPPRRLFHATNTFVFVIIVILEWASLFTVQTGIDFLLRSHSETVFVKGTAGVERMFKEC